MRPGTALFVEGKVSDKADLLACRIVFAGRHGRSRPSGKNPWILNRVADGPTVVSGTAKRLDRRCIGRT